jgi:DNA-binding MarR family transcriptional regulator
MTRVQKIILDALDILLEATVSEIMDMTSIARSTLSDNLKILVSNKRKINRY